MSFDNGLIANARHFLSGRASKYWLVLNVILPIAVSVAFGATDLVMKTQQRLALFTVFVILVGNIAALIKFPATRIWFGTIAVLNILAVFAIGDVSFVTAIPEIPLIARGIYFQLSQPM